MYANDGVVKHMNSKVTENKAASGGGLYMGKAGLFELIEIPDCGNDKGIKCSTELLIKGNEACLVNQGYDNCAVHKSTPIKISDGTMSSPECPSTICKAIIGRKNCEETPQCLYDYIKGVCYTYIQTPMDFSLWSENKACAARLSGRGLFRGGNINVEGDVTLDGMSVTHGRAEIGGAVFINAESKSTLSRCSIMYNRAMDKGGGMYFGYKANVDLVYMVISKNHAKLGGGLYLDRCYGTHYVLNVSQNTASEAGGGIYVMQRTKFEGSNSSLFANSIQQQKDESSITPIGGSIDLNYLCLIPLAKLQVKICRYKIE
jgi:predicted outer membrane repeat protein